MNSRVRSSSLLVTVDLDYYFFNSHFEKRCTTVDKMIFDVIASDEGFVLVCMLLLT